MRLNSGKILGINITLDPRETILEEIKKYLFFSPQPSAFSRQKRQTPMVIVTPNPEQIVLAQYDTQFKEILNQADVAIPDGAGIIFATRFLNGKWQMANGKWKLKRIAGVDFMEELVALAAQRGYRIGLIGGRGGVAVRALECLSTKYPKLRGWTFEPGDIYPSDLSNLSTLSDLKIIAEKIRSSQLQIIFVGLGAPKQEYFIHILKSYLLHLNSPVILMSVGGSFDIIAGKIQRAPLFVRKIGFEWVWRLLHEPWRIRRQLALIKFAVLVFREAVRTR